MRCWHISPRGMAAEPAPSPTTPCIRLSTTGGCRFECLLLPCAALFARERAPVASHIPRAPEALLVSLRRGAGVRRRPLGKGMILPQHLTLLQIA